MNKLVPWCAWLLSSALEILRLGLGCSTGGADKEGSRRGKALGHRYSHTKNNKDEEKWMGERRHPRWVDGWNHIHGEFI